MLKNPNFAIISPMEKSFKDIYKDHAEMPYIAPQYEMELMKKPIAKRQMERTTEGFLPGHIILLWRISFGTFLTTSFRHKYFYTTYGIDADKELDMLIEAGYVRIETAFESLRHLPAGELKDFLKAKDVIGLSKMKRSDLDGKMAELYREDELANLFELRSYALTEKGQALLAAHPEIVDKHPQKKF